MRIDLQKVFSMVPREEELEQLLGDLEKAEHYEIHITVKSDGEIEQFKEACALLEVKPLVVQLSEGQVPDDVMTSSSITCTPSELRDECVRILVGLEAMEWRTVRCKIECSPFHEKVVNLEPKDILSFQYFEAHIPVRVAKAEPLDRLKAACSVLDVHMSANAFKVDDDMRTIMITYRSTEYGALDFRRQVSSRIESINEEGFDTRQRSTVVEFAIFDSNRAHDDSWLKIIA